MKLLSDQSSNAKLSKNTSVNDRWQTSILYLAPANEADPDVNLCPGSTPGCRATCLFTAGRGQMSCVRTARIRKTLLFLNQRQHFLGLLGADLERLVKRQKKTGIRQAIRLNGTSDVRWELIPVERSHVPFQGIPQAFPELQFYDYTKLPNRSKNLPPNYSLTFSQSEANARVAHASPFNVASVFRHALPATWLGRPVIDGTTHDMRFLDPKGVVVGLLAKGQAVKDRSGFVQTQRTIESYHEDRKQKRISK